MATFEGPEFEELKHTIPTDNAQQANLGEMFKAASGPGLVLDLGCGDGRAVELIRGTGADYVGVDIEQSPEVASRQRTDEQFLTYNGTDLPFGDDHFDAVYSNQVFEHVRHPDRLLCEVLRVLKPGGRFVAALSYLEPYHSYSIFNYTPYGVFRVLSDNGFELEEMRPGPEGLGMIVRQISARRIKGLKLVYPGVDIALKLRRIDVRKANYLKLRFAGHILFTARKPA
ncbi:class I SAM-dependent methyltransferase [Croceicoccus sediminis]|uniref:class I SAM-dependent methyltransferase n=1 Tax=Croceicoccus sediminis TaxID=2571150 RepID=UPI001181F035|nr:class I SAM-dependent methyltransferase [Croceicoccus sediminis]